MATLATVVEDFGDHGTDVKGHDGGEFGLCGVGEGRCEDAVFDGVGSGVGVEGEARVALWVGGGTAVEGTTV